MKTHLNQKRENRKTVYLCKLMEFSNVCPKGGLIVKREQKTHERKKTKGERKGSQTTTQHVPLRKTARHGERQAVGQKQLSVPVQTVSSLSSFARMQTLLPLGSFSTTTTLPINHLILHQLPHFPPELMRSLLGCV